MPADKSVVTERLETLKMIGMDVTNTMAKKLSEILHSTDQVLLNDDSCKNINEYYWSIVKEFKKRHKFGTSRINNPKIASITLYSSCLVGDKVISIPGRQDYEEYANIRFCRQIVRAFLFYDNNNGTKKDWANFDLCVRELRTFKPKEWQPVIPLLIYRFENIWASTRKTDRERWD